MPTVPLHYTPPSKTGKLDADELREFLRQPWNARLATVTPEGTPYIAPVWYEYDPDADVFYVVGRERSAYVAHLATNPAVALHIADDAHMEHTRVLVEGRATIEAGPVAPDAMPRLREMVNDMARRYMGPDGPRYAAATMNRPRVLIAITPTRVQSWTGGAWAAPIRKDDA